MARSKGGATVRILSPRPRGARRAGDQRIFVESAFQCAVVEWRAPAGSQAEQLRQLRIAAEQIRGPAGEALFQRVAQAWIEGGQFRCIRLAHTVGRVADDDSCRS